jgi:hypothetical protein
MFTDELQENDVGCEGKYKTRLSFGSFERLSMSGVDLATKMYSEYAAYLSGCVFVLSWQELGLSLCSTRFSSTTTTTTSVLCMCKPWTRHSPCAVAFVPRDRELLPTSIVFGKDMQLSPH